MPGPEHPPSPDYVPGPKHPPSPDYVHGLESPEYLVPSDDEEDPEEDPAEYPADGGYDNGRKLPFIRPISPLLLPATDRMEDVLEADVPPRKRLCLTSPAPRFEVGESSAAAAARQLRLDVTHATDYSFVDIVDATPRRPMSRENNLAEVKACMSRSSCAAAERGLKGILDILTDTFSRDTDRTRRKAEPARYP
ncbi:hypothetical protein Tco_1349538 [Tanacetum coccineum]